MFPPTKKIELLNFRSLHFCGWCSTELFTSLHLAFVSGKNTNCPLTSTCHVKNRNTFLLMHAHKILEPQLSLVILNYNEYLCLVIQWLLSAYLFIYLNVSSFNFLWAIQLCYNMGVGWPTKTCNLQLLLHNEKEPVHLVKYCKYLNSKI